MFPFFNQATLVAGEFVEMQLRVKLVVEFTRWKLVTLGTPVMKAGTHTPISVLTIVAIHQLTKIMRIGIIFCIDQTKVEM